MFYTFLIIASSFIPLKKVKNQKGIWIEIQAKGKLTKSINFFQWVFCCIESSGALENLTLLCHSSCQSCGRYDCKQSFSSHLSMD